MPGLINVSVVWCWDGRNTSRPEAA